MPAAASPPATDSRDFVARLAELAQTARFARAFCSRHELPEATALRLTLVLEELFANTVTHGHRGDSQAVVRVTLAIESGALRVVYEDQAPAFDPLSVAGPAAASLDQAQRERRVGGLGLPLTLGMTREQRYTRLAGANRLELTIVDEPPPTEAYQRAPKA